MAHHDLGFKLFVEFQSNADYDQQARCAECACKAEVFAQGVEQECRHNRKYCKEDCSEQSDTIGNASQIICGCFARTDTRNEAAVLLNVSGHVVRIELHLRIEVRKEYNQKNHHNVVNHAAHRVVTVRSEVLGVESNESAGPTEHLDKHRREAHEGACEDYRHNAATVDADRNVGGLSAVHLVAFNLLRVLHGDATFAAVHEYDEEEYRDNQQKESDKVPHERRSRLHCGEAVEDNGACGGQNAHEDDKRRAVADAVFGDPFGKPHAEHAACDEEHDAEHDGEPVALHAEKRFDCAVVVPVEHDAHGLNGRKTQCDVSGDLSNLLSAFFAFLGKFFQFRNYQRKKLHDDECVDERNDTQSKQRALAHASARNRAQHAQKSFARQAGNNARIETGQRHEATQTIYNEQRQRSVNFYSYFFRRKSIFQGFKH